MEFLKEPYGKLSFSRVMSFLSITLYLIVFLYYAIFKDQIIDLPTNFSLLIGGLYGFNKLGGAIEGKKIESNK